MTGSVLRHRLANGLTVLVRRDAAAPVVAIVTHVKAGYFDEPDRLVGVAHVLEHMYFKGTPGRGVGEIARATKAAGGYLNAATIYDQTQYYAVLPAAGFAAGLAVQADAFARSLVDAVELARELEVIVEEAQRKADTPAAVTLETLYAQLFDRHRMRRWRIGTPEGLRALTRDDVVAFYRAHYVPSNTILAIVGDVDPEAALAEVEQWYGPLPPGTAPADRGPAEPGWRGFRYHELTGDVAQVPFALGWPTVPPLHPDAVALELAALALGGGRASRLYRAVREPGLAAGVTAWHYAPTEVGVLAVQAETAPARAPDALAAAWRAALALAEAPLDEAELARVRAGVDARWRRRLETVEGQATHLAAWEALGDWRLGEAHRDALLSVAAATVRDACARWLVPERAALVVYRPRDTVTLAGDATAMRALLDRPGPSPAPAPAAPALRLAPRSAHPVGEVARDVHAFRTDAGVPVLVRVKRGAPIVHAGVFVAGGAVDDPAPLAGRTTLGTRAVLRGSASRDGAALATALEALGGAVGSVAATESFGWTVSAPPDAAAAALALLAEIVIAPAFAADAVAAERQAALAQLAQVADDMYRQPARLAAETAWPGHPYGRLALGTAEGLAAVDAEALRVWHAAQVRTAASVIVLVGDGDPAALAAHAAAAFAALRPAPAAPVAPAPWPRRALTRVEAREKRQTALQLLFPGPARRDPARLSAEVLAAIASGLGGRFFETLRDRESLAYTVHVGTTARRVAGTISAYIATSPGKEAQARDGLLRELARLRDEPPTAEELARAQAYLAGTDAIRAQSGASVLAEVADAWVHDALADLDTRADRLRAVTATDVAALADRYLDPRWVVEGVVRGR